MSDKGKVYLVGAGPGDPKLITVRGAELIARADVIVNDRLANPKLLNRARADAEIIYAGKSAHDHHLTQDRIIDLIIDRARQGKTVARLKGGDPFVFGRGGEEAEALASAGIEFEIVPGVSSSVAVPAYAGIPVTGRMCASSFAVVTGHESADKQESAIRWDKLATGADTIVLMMGVENLPATVEALVANGRSADTPAAVIQWGTHATQRTVVGTLANIVGKCREAGVTAPAVTVIGEVVRLRERIEWFEKRPLFGKRVVVTRARHQASALTALFEELGAAVDEFPVIRFDPPSDTGPLDSAIAKLDSYDWIVFTSANGVEWFLKRLRDLGRDVRALGNARLAAIGPKTAAALHDLRLNVDYVPTEYVAEALAAQFPGEITGSRVLIPRAKEAREELPEGLRARGVHVDVVPVYETVFDMSCAEEIRSKLAEGVDVLTFTSASTVRAFFAAAGDVPAPASTLVACMGPITAAAVREHGLEAHIVADEYTIEGLVDAVAAHFSQVAG